MKTIDKIMKSVDNNYEKFRKQFWKVVGITDEKGSREKCR